MRANQGIFQGVLNAELSRIDGTWTQDRSDPLELVRTRDAPARKVPKPSKISGLPGQRLLDISAGIGPTPFVGADNRTHLVYELYLANATNFELHLTRLEVLDGTATVASFEGVDLNNILGILSDTEKDLDHRTLRPHQRAVAYLWITFQSPADPPAKLRHRYSGRPHRGRRRDRSFAGQACSDRAALAWIGLGGI